MNQESSIFPIAANEVAPMTLRMRISDESLDRMGTILSTDGWDLRNYQKNPVVLNGHRLDDVTEVIAKATRTWTQDGALWQDWLWATECNPKALTAYHLYRSGFCRAASVRFIPLAWQDGGPHDHFRKRYTKQELTEVSACGVPLNPNALARALQSCGAPTILIDTATQHEDTTRPQIAALLAREIQDTFSRLTNQAP